jgi:hypothetical protein
MAIQLSNEALTGIPPEGFLFDWEEPAPGQTIYEGISDKCVSSLGALLPEECV